MDIKKRLTDEQVIGFLKQPGVVGTPIDKMCRKYGFSDAYFYFSAAS